MYKIVPKCVSLLIFYYICCENRLILPLLMSRSSFSHLALGLTCLMAGVDGQAQQFSCRELPNQAQLPVANVSVVMQDRQGYLWYGTAGGGLCSDDGYTVTAYSTATVGQGVMQSDEVTCVAEDSVGHIWFGTRDGLYYVDKAAHAVHQVDNELVAEHKIHCIGVTHDGSVWVGVERNIVKFSSAGVFQKSLSIGTNRREEPKEMTVDSRGTLWVTILRGGLVTIDPTTDRLTHQPWDYPSAASYLLEDTVRHCYWVGTWGGGIVRYPDMVVEPATLIATENQHFGSEVYNLWIDQRRGILWSATMDDVYAYRLRGTNAASSSQSLLLPLDTRPFLPQGKKLLNKLVADRRGNVWVPGFSPHTFVLSPQPDGGGIRRDAVQAMTDQMGYKVMVHRVAVEDDYLWIYQNRTRLSLYRPATGALSFMATDAHPTPLSTQKPLSRCREGRGVWTCEGKHLIHVWHEGMRICWEEVAGAQTPNYISALSDEGQGRLLIGTEKQVLLYDYRHQRLQPLADSDGVVRQVGYDAQGKLFYSTDPQAPKQVTDARGHVWTLNELTLTERNPKTGASRVLRAADKDIQMDSFTDLTVAGDSVCLGGIGAYCMVGSCAALDVVHPADSIVVTAFDSLTAIRLSTFNHLHAAQVTFAYRFSASADWQELPPGENTIRLAGLPPGRHTLTVRATDEYGVWHEPQTLCTFVIPRPWYGSLWALLAYALAAVLALAAWLRWRHGRASAPAESAQPVSSEAVEVAEPTGGAAPSASSASSDSAAPTSPAAPTPRQQFFARVDALVAQHLDNSDYGVDDLCRDLGMSRMNMYRRFQSLSETTPSEYIRNYRLAQAADLLRHTSQSVTEIAYAVGFTSPQYFAKCFKEVYGVSPKQFRTV